MRSGRLRGAPAASAVTEDAGAGRQTEHAFEMIVLGSGGGPLETDLSGFMLKPAADDWKDGFLAVEGGSGLGALVNLFKRPSANTALFPTYAFPTSHDTPLLQASHIFSHLSAYVLSHAHLDHAVSLVIASGSLPSELEDPDTEDELEPTRRSKSPDGRRLRTPVFGTQTTLEKLQAVYHGDLWPELGKWSDTTGQMPHTPATLPDETGQLKRKRRTSTDDETNDQVLDPPEVLVGAGVQFCPLAAGPSYTALLPSRSISASPYPIAHGCTSQGIYESSALFLKSGNVELLFWGDTESSFEREPAACGPVENLNEEVWRNAARKFKDGVLRAVFIECSYTSSRPADRMFGHLSPPSLMHEIGTLAAFVGSQPLPLDGLKIFVTHVKDSLYPHRSGKTVKQRVQEELEQLERQRRLGVIFEVVEQGQRLLF